MPYIGQGLQQGRRQLHTFTATASQTTFIASYTPGYVDVYQNGILLAPNDYTATNGTSVVLGVGAAVSDEITIIAQHLFSVADVVSASTGGTFAGDVTMTGNLTVQGTTITVDTNTAQTLAMGDADKIKLGDDGDLEIYHSGSDSFIDDTGTGSLILRSGTTYIQNAAGTKTSIATNAGAGQTLYFNNTSKFQTTDNGALVGDGLGTEVLTILANSGGESQLRFADGTTGTAAYQGRVEYEHTAGKLNLGAGGVTQVTIDSAGNMGLGTNSPTPTASNYDSASFHIRQVGSSSVGAQIRFSTGATGHTASDGTFMAQWADSNFYITNQEANADIRFNAGGNSDMVVFDGQNGGVGINFSDPASTGAKLAVMGIAGSNAVFVKGNAGSGTSWGMGINAGSTSADASFRVYDKDGSNSYLYVRGDGNVGIGTDSPSNLLTVVNSVTDAYSPSSFNDKPSITIKSQDGTNNYSGIRFTNVPGGYEYMFGSVQTSNSNDYADMVIQGYDWGATTYKEYLRVKNDGSLGIGTASPGYKLQVDHGTTAQYASSIRNTADNLQLLLGTTTGGLLNIQGKTINSNAAYNIALQADGGNVGIGTSQPSVKLHVVGGGDANLYLKSDSNRSGAFLMKPGTNTVMGSLLQLSDESYRLGTASNYHIQMNQDGKTILNATGNNVGIGTTSPIYPLDVRGVFISPIGYSSTHTGAHANQYPITNRTIINGRVNLSFNVYFQHNTSNLAVRLYAPVTSWWGSGEVIMGSTYSYGNASGFRRYTFTHNYNSGTNYNHTLTNTENRGSTSSHMELHSHGWDATEGAHYWEFRHIVSSGNTLYCQFQTFGSGTTTETVNYYYRHVTY